MLTQPLKVRYGKVVDLEDQADGGMQVWSAEVTNSDRRQFSLNPRKQDPRRSQACLQPLRNALR